MDHRHHHHQERRSSPRFSSELLLTFVGEGFEVKASTRNISCSGMHCEITRFVPVMTRLAVTLFVPLIVNSRKVEHQLCCSAVVVRSEPEQEQHTRTVYRVGCFFTDLSPTDREIITRYIEQAFLAKRN